MSGSRKMANVNTNFYSIQAHLLFKALLLSCNALSLNSLIVNYHLHKAGLYSSIKPQLRLKVLLIFDLIRLSAAPDHSIGLHRLGRLLLHPMWLFHRSPASILPPRSDLGHTAYFHTFSLVTIS